MCVGAGGSLDDANAYGNATRGVATGDKDGGRRAGRLLESWGSKSLISAGMGVLVRVERIVFRGVGYWVASGIGSGGRKDKEGVV